MGAVVVNPFRGTAADVAAGGALRPGPGPRTFHGGIPGYRPTPLVDVATVAEQVGAARVLVKHEADRFGLPAFKILGASWATACLVGRRLGLDPTSTSHDELRRAAADQLAGVTLVTATDGNHGRAVARAAAWLGVGAHIFVPAGTVDARIDAIAGEGATVSVVDGDYDHAVATAAALADDRHLVVSDTSWAGYTEVPTDIAAGYATIFEEIDEQMAILGIERPDAVVVPVGVGALAVAAVAHWPAGPPDGPARIAVEPTSAACLVAAIEADGPVTVPGPHTSIMAGMNCGTVSPVAWPAMRAGIDRCVTVDDDDAREAMRRLADAGLVVGETGAASVAALLAAARPAGGSLAVLGLGPEAVVVCLCTEGATDPVGYRTIVGRAPEEVGQP